MEEIRLSWAQLFQYTAIIHGAIGFLLGLIPFVAGIVKKKIRLGALGLLVGTFAGVLLGFLGSIPSMAIFTWLILRDRHIAEESPAGSKADETGETAEN